MTELEEARSLLKDACVMLDNLVRLLSMEEENHSKDVASLRAAFNGIAKHHADEIKDLHDLVHRSEERIDRTNAMIVELSHTITELNTTNKELKASYIEEFNRTNAQVSHLVEENYRLVKENEAYYAAYKREKERNDTLTDSLARAALSSRSSHAPLVNIDQK